LGTEKKAGHGVDAAWVVGKSKGRLCVVNWRWFCCTGMYIEIAREFAVKDVDVNNDW
jgi:hypothetical protein